MKKSPELPLAWVFNRLSSTSRRSLVIRVWPVFWNAWLSISVLRCVVIQINIRKFILFELGRKIRRHDCTQRKIRRHKCTQLEQLRIIRKKNRFNWIQTHDLCDTGAMLYQLSYQGNWELVTLWVRNIPVDVEEYKPMWKIIDLNYGGRYEDIISSCVILLWHIFYMFCCFPAGLVWKAWLFFYHCSAWPGCLVSWPSIRILSLFSICLQSSIHCRSESIYSN